jgi:hypothetical protein
VTTIGPAADQVKPRQHDDGHAAWADFQSRVLKLAGFESAGEHVEYGERWICDFLCGDVFITVRIERPAPEPAS